MENVILTILLILAVLLTGVVLLQRSEGGGLGMGGGSGGGVMTGRQAANALTKLTWILGAGFMIAALAMTIIAAKNSAGVSVVDRLGEVETAPAASESTTPAIDIELPPASADAPLTPPAAE